MKLLHLLAVLLIISCTDSSSKQKSKQKILPVSNGRINHLSIVTTNSIWDGMVGDAIREVFAAPVEGLPQEEPLFTLKHIPPKAFKSFQKQNRIIFRVQKADTTDIVVEDDFYARPQRLITVSGSNQEAIVAEIKKQAEKMVNDFKEVEIKEKQKRISKSLHKTDKLKDKLGLSLKFPTVYRIAKDGDNFFWIRKDIREGGMNIMVYEIPIEDIDTEGINSIIKIRDSIGKKYIPGQKEGSYLITEKAFTPFSYQSSVEGKPTLITKGTWEVKNVTMAGPFINYAIEDKANNRYIIVEGFTYAPSVEKRDFMFELESIIQSIKFK